MPGRAKIGILVVSPASLKLTGEEREKDGLATIQPELRKLAAVLLEERLGLATIENYFRLAR